MNRLTWIALLAILLLAALLRLHRVGEMALRADEAAHLFLAAQEPDAIIRPFIESDPHLPLYFLLLHFWVRLAGPSELAVRYPTVMVGALLVALVYAFGRMVFPRRAQIACLSALLAAVNPYLIWDAQDAHVYSFLTAITLSSWIAFLRARQPGAALAAWTWYVVASVLGLWFHYLAGLAVIAQGALWLFWSATRAISRRTTVAWIIALIAVTLLFLPWLFVALPLLTRFKIDFFPPADWFEMLQRSLVAFSLGRSDNRLMPAMVEPLLGTGLALGFLVILLFGLFARAGDANGRIALALYLCVPLVALFLFSLWRFPIFDERYVLFLTPAFLLLLARGVVSLQELTKRKWVSAGAVAFIVLTTSHSLYNYWYVPAFAKSPDWQSFVQRLVAESQPGDVLIQNYPDPALPYYLHERVPRVLLPRSSSATSAEVSADLDRLTAKYARVWLQPVPYAEWDTEGLVETWLNRHARQLRAYEFRGLRLALYLPAAAAVRQAREIDVTFDAHIRLIAFDLDIAGGTLRADTPLHLVLYWEALDRVEREATVFVHLYGEDGRLWAQQDNPPVRGTFPTRAWETNLIVVDPYALRLPADASTGIYSLAVGMYDPHTLQRLHAVDKLGQPLPEHRVVLAQFNLLSALESIDPVAVSSDASAHIDRHGETPSKRRADASSSEVAAR